MTESRKVHGARGRHRARRRSSFGTGLAAIVLVGACLEVGGCEARAPGAAYECRCSFISDTDVPMQQTFSVCATNDHEADAAARSCQGPGVVNGCTCTRTTQPCKSGCR